SAADGRRPAIVGARPATTPARPARDNVMPAVRLFGPDPLATESWEPPICGMRSVLSTPRYRSCSARIRGETWNARGPNHVQERSTLPGADRPHSDQPDLPGRRYRQGDGLVGHRRAHGHEGDDGRPVLPDDGH